MPSSPFSGRQRDALLQHLDSLFALAQVVSPNAHEAVALVEATFRRAFTDSVQPDEATYAPPLPPETAPIHTDDEARQWLFRLMMQIRNERAGEDAKDSAVARSAETSSRNRVDLAEFQGRLAEEFVDRTLPPAFATLPADQRVLLMLCEVETMDCTEAARVLGLGPEDACARLEQARASLSGAVYAQATVVERKLLETGLSANWQRAALHRMADARLVVVPPTLRPSVASIFKSIAPSGRSGQAGIEAGEDADEGVSAEAPSMGLLQKFGAMLTIIAVAGLLGYAFTYFTRHEPNVNLISLSAQQASSVEASFQTTSAEQAERYIHDRLGNRVTLPVIAEASLMGVSIRSMADGAEVPVLLFKDPSTPRPVAIYVYSYAFLDRHQKNLVLEHDILRQIASEGNFDLHDLGEEKALVWRSRDDIFVAITSGDADELRDRITLPS